VLRTLDFIHLATAPAVGDDLEAIVSYDARMIDAATVRLPTTPPRESDLLACRCSPPE
jgi:predicted nucleic acid-binding protein